MLNPSARLAMSSSFLEALPGKLDVKSNPPSILYISAPLSFNLSDTADPQKSAISKKYSFRKLSSIRLYYIQSYEKQDNID